MVYQPNQINDVFQNALSRPATDHEVTTYQNSSPQTLATIKDTYSALNPNSLSDYLKSVGQDNSFEARTTLGQKYGIPNVGTAEGNMALLNALKSGKKPSTAVVGGSIVPPAPLPTSTPPVTPANALTDLTTEAQKANPNNGQQPASTPAIDGSISAAATPVSTDITSDPGVSTAKTNVDTALQNYQSAQQAVAGIDAQIASLRATITGAMQDKENQAAASGGVVSRSQIASEVSYETQQIQNQINDLLSQRAPLATSQAQYATALQQARTDYQDAQNNFYKGATLAQGQEKISNQASQFAIKTAEQQTQFEAKLKQAGIKYLKFTDPDTGQIYYLDTGTGNPISIDTNGNPINPATGSTTSTDTETSAAGIITDPTGNKYDISTYATDPQHTQKVNEILQNIPQLTSVADIQAYIDKVAPNSPITGQMVYNASQKNGAVSWEAMLALMQEETKLGTDGSAGAKGNNFGNIGNSDTVMASGTPKNLQSAQVGVNAVAKWLNGHKVDTTGATSNTSPTGTPLPDKTMEQAAQDLADGKASPLPYSATRSTGTTATFNRNQEILQRAEQINPQFKPSQATIQYNYANNPNTQTTIQQINKVYPNIDKIISLANDFKGGNIAPLNNLLIQAGIATSNKKAANLGQAQKLIGDELGSVLGSGGGSDIKIGLGLDVVDPTLSPEAFASNMAQLKTFLNNASNSVYNQMGIYAPSVTINGNDYRVGTKLSLGNLTFTVNGDDTLAGSDGNTYDVNGNIIND